MSPLRLLPWRSVVEPMLRFVLRLRGQQTSALRFAVRPRLSEEDTMPDRSLVQGVLGRERVTSLIRFVYPS
ncbi:MAG: hypothetical protein C4346_13985 [Chloroflexota bacterium]